MPLPGAGDDLVQFSELRLPAQLGLNLLRACDQHRRIAGTALLLFHCDRAAGDAAHGVDDLAHCEAVAVADVVDEAAALSEGVEGENMRIGEVTDVDVVADAGAVLGGVVVAKDLDASPAAEGDVEDERDEVRLGLVRLAVAVDGSGDIEVAQAGVAEV